ncbi:14494_t:CDS:2 [Entrophospora sp. SA101]|nr:14494_t:CDS:2 [Entrophospora sp. SA101]
MSSPVKIKYPINSYYTSIIIIWEIPFDYSKFLKQIDHKNATKIARMVKNFELEFERHPRTINDQIKFVREFLDFITGKMRECELWRNASEQEFENAKEGIEKLVMNRLHKLTFTPAIKGPPVTDDIERDNILYQKIEIFRWVREQHLDIPITPHNEAFFDFAKKGNTCSESNGNNNVGYLADNKIIYVDNNDIGYSESRVGVEVEEIKFK